MGMTKEEAMEMISKIRADAHKIECEVMDGGKLPAKAHKEDAGFDVYATEDINLYPGQVYKSPLNIRLKLPKGTYVRVETKSGLGSKGMLVFAGIIDEMYRGMPHVIMSNINVISNVDEDGFPLMRTEPLQIKKGDKLAQLIVHPYTSEYYMEQVDKVDAETNRGTGGFGSTGTS